VFAFTKLNLARQFLLASFLVLLVGMLVIGNFVSNKIRVGVLNETAMVTALYVDSFISPHLQDLNAEGLIDEIHKVELNRLIQNSSLKEQIVSFKVWSTEGRIIYSPNTDLIGRYFGLDAQFENALSGQVISEISILNEAEHVYESQYWDRLIETYAPIRADNDGEVIAISEFYQLPDNLDSQIDTAQTQSWLVVGISTFLMYVLLTSIVGRASNTILVQQEDLNQKVNQLTEMLSQNTALHNRVRKAAARTTALNEQFLRRTSADLHDGPIQDLALSLLRIEEVSELYQDSSIQNPEGDLIVEALKLTQATLASSLKEFRSILSGARLPDLEIPSPAEVAKRAIRDYRRKTKKNVEFFIDDVPNEAPLPVKIALYRVIQEALLNGFHHSNGASQSVRLLHNNGDLQLEVYDNGKGFDPKAIEEESHLGLAGMRERIEMLGGSFIVESAPGEGTSIQVVIPIEISTDLDYQGTISNNAVINSKRTSKSSN